MCKDHCSQGKMWAPCRHPCATRATSPLRSAVPAGLKLSSWMSCKKARCLLARSRWLRRPAMDDGCRPLQPSSAGVQQVLHVKIWHPNTPCCFTCESNQSRGRRAPQPHGSERSQTCGATLGTQECRKTNIHSASAITACDDLAVVAAARGGGGGEMLSLPAWRWESGRASDESKLLALTR